MKTVKQWLETLPEPYRTQALANLKDQSCSDTANVKFDNGRSALAVAFTWSLSPEGQDYWRLSPL